MSDASDRGLRMLEGLELPDRYAVRRPIATGGMASVWWARDRALGRQVAIKVISGRFARDRDAQLRFNREAQAAARLSSHRHVVTIYDVGQAIDRSAPLGRPFIVMEFLAGGTVADAIRVHAVTRPQAVRWLEQAATAIDYAHGCGVIHRDIKPGNMLLDSERVLHVADFGIARLASEETVGGPGLMLGTAAYIAPEQVRGHAATEASDRYALAVTAFELLVGVRPFKAEQFAAQARQHVEDEPPAASWLNPELPPSLDEILVRGMAKRPEERWASASEFAEAIAGALGTRTEAPARAVQRRSAPAARSELPAAPAPPRTSPRRATAPRTTQAAPGRGGRRRVLALGALIAGVLAVVVAAAASGMFGSGHPQAAGHLNANLRAATPTGTTARPPAGRPHHVPAPSRPHPHARASTPPTSGTVKATPVAATTPPPTADELEARGHELLADGDFAAAIPLLREAASAASPASPTYAYALFDLGRSLRLAGDPRAAATVLWQRIQIPNHRGIVRGELQQALRELGAQARSGHHAQPPRKRSRPGRGGRPARA